MHKSWCSVLFGATCCSFTHWFLLCTGGPHLKQRAWNIKHCNSYIGGEAIVLQTTILKASSNSLYVATKWFVQMLQQQIVLSFVQFAELLHLQFIFQCKPLVSLKWNWPIVYMVFLLSNTCPFGNKLLSFLFVMWYSKVFYNFNVTNDVIWELKCWRDHWKLFCSATAL